MANLKEQIKALKDPRMLTVFMQGYSSGLPLFLSAGTLQLWLTQSGVNLKDIGLLSSVGLPYTLKFLWSPALDRFLLPLGRRKGWIFFSQVCIALALLFMSFCDPSSNLIPITIGAFVLAFMSATQDIALDAWRREYLKDEEIGMGIALNTTGYMLAMRFIAGVLAYTLAADYSWSLTYQVMALLMVPGMITTLLSREPKMEFKAPRTFQETVIAPLAEFMQRKGAWFFLAFILLYKIGDNVAGVLTNPFYLKMNYTLDEIKYASKLFGFIAIIGGTMLGGAALYKVKLRHALWFFGIFQALSTAAFACLQLYPKSLSLLYGVIGFENFTAGLGTAAYATLIARLTNKKFTASQYALLTSLMSVPRIIIGTRSGYMQESLGWVGFFAFCALIAIPGILMSFKIKEAPTGEISI